MILPEVPTVLKLSVFLYGVIVGLAIGSWLQIRTGSRNGAGRLK